MTADRVRIRLEPLGVELDVPSGGSLVAALSAHGIEFPCGGMDECGGCAIRVLSGTLPVTDSDRAVFSADQLAAGWRLACHARPDSQSASPLVLECGQWRMEILADTAAPCPIQAESAPADSLRGQAPISGNSVACPIQTKSASADSVWVGTPHPGKSGLGIAIDLGTTTIAAQLVDLTTGNVLGVETLLNPQAVFGSDVMSRIRAALEGRDLTTPIRAALGRLVTRLAAGREHEIAELLLVGNTVMHHLFSGLSVEPLSHVPFQSPHLEEQRFTPGELGWNLPPACSIRFARCIGGFVGSDILAGIVATGIANSPDLSALIDLGTNGEIVIGSRSGLVCASTAAGPAFEAGSIRMGMMAVTGAISYVSLAAGALRATVIGDVAPRGICGSGLVDAVAAGLRSGAILPSGRIAGGTKLFPIAPPVVLCQSDVRELQLAKGAIASGFRLLLKRLGANCLVAQNNGKQSSVLKGHDFSRAVRDANETRALAPGEMTPLRAIHLAGAFGNYVQIQSALRIGLIEAPREIIHAAGNTALRGARMLLLAGGEPSLPPIEHISLAADPAFQDEFAACMTFPASL